MVCAVVTVAEWVESEEDKNVKNEALRGSLDDMLKNGASGRWDATKTDRLLRAAVKANIKNGLATGDVVGTLGGLGDAVTPNPGVHGGAGDGGVPGGGGSGGGGGGGAGGGGGGPVTKRGAPKAGSNPIDPSKHGGDSSFALGNSLIGGGAARAGGAPVLCMNVPTVYKTLAAY